MFEEYQQEVQRKIAERTTVRQELPERIKNLLTIVNSPANDGDVRRRAQQQLEKYKSEGFLSWEGV